MLRAGDVLRAETLPQIRYELMRYDGNRLVGVCAGGSLVRQAPHLDYPTIDFLATVKCPVSDCSGGFFGEEDTLWGIMVHLNNEHKWTFHQIADFLDQHDTAVKDVQHVSPRGLPESTSRPKTRVRTLTCA